MGIFGALNTAVSGLKAQSFALENISGNIANSSTTAYKRTDTAFSDLVLGGERSNKTRTAGSVMAYTRQTNSVGASPTASSSSTSLAVNGSGYLIVQDATGSVNGAPTFGGGDLYTRRGDFELDKNGYLVNGPGYYLKGYALDPTTGARTGSSTELIQVDGAPYPAAATGAITYNANLPSEPKTTNYVSGDESSWLLGSTLGSTISASESDAFLASSVAGDSVTVYDGAGASYDVQFRWGKLTNADATAGTSDTWALFYQSNSSATGDETAWTQVDADAATAGTQAFTFEDGVLTSPAGGSATIAGLSINGTNLGDVTLSTGATGLTQYADATGLVDTSRVSQDGSAAGDYLGLEITDGGQVVASYSNGRTRALYDIPVATFAAENQLQQLDGGAFAATVASGDPTIGDGSSIVGSALEQSNVDIADEFTKLIVTQQAYSANTRVVTTSDSMLQEALAMIR
ncbi:flagellar hook protein FlgE [Methylopila musalis]|uniref:Flagellar hook protein FlgE n=1 Tax=Methylopila musalis TaxID=1134781 RepID=A0ABW3Z6T1_9HYPH